jgi:hypothetical protein
VVDLGANRPWDALVNFHNTVVATDDRLAAKSGLATQDAPKGVLGARPTDADAAH